MIAQTDVVEEEEDIPAGTEGPEDGGAGLESWKYEDERSDTSDEEDDEAFVQEGAGVLGLIKKLQRRQSEGNRAHPGI